jgi:hypothetical protein
MFDLPYIVTRPLLAAIAKRCAVLAEEADALPLGSAPRRDLEKRISQLEQYKLPKPDARELEESEPIFNDSGQKIGERHSLRRRVIAKRRGRPEEFRIRTRAALEEKLAHPRTTWREVAIKHRFQDRKDLERFVRVLKDILKREGIALPTEDDYARAAAECAQLFAPQKK